MPELCPLLSVELADEQSEGTKFVSTCPTDVVGKVSWKLSSEEPCWTLSAVSLPFSWKFSSRVLNQALYFFGLETPLIPLLFLVHGPQGNHYPCSQVFPSLYHPARPCILKEAISLPQGTIWVLGGRGNGKKTLGVTVICGPLKGYSTLTVYLCIKI